MDLDTEELEATKILHKRKKYKNCGELLIENYSEKIYKIINEEEE